MMGATTAAASVTGVRAWLATRGYSWLTPRRSRFLSGGLIFLGLIGASVGFNSA